jgi:hypothetical protein
MSYAYPLILTVTVALTWNTNDNQIIAYALRVFALYYVLHGAVAILASRSVIGAR